MADDDSLVATRSRRANAGSRLKQLIELEEQANEVQDTISHIITEDDENVNLLFQEDENDEEFIEEEEEEEEQGEEEEEEEETEEFEGKRIGKRSRDTDNEDEEIENINPDEILSESDLSVTDTDESEGEKELQRQEKLKKRKVRKKQSIIPAIKKVQVNDKQQPKKPKSNLVTSDSLLLAVRRSSSRAAVVESKHALIQKLKESEKRRANAAPIIRLKHTELTQEEKLVEAVETEKANTLALNQFMEQEIVKKERQRQLLISKRVKLKNVLRLVSKESLITPLDEVHEARHVQELLNKSKRKPGRRRKVSVDPEIKRLPGEIDSELPLVKEELERERLQKEQVSKIGTEFEENSIDQRETEIKEKGDTSETSLNIVDGNIEVLPTELGQSTNKAQNKESDNLPTIEASVELPVNGKLKESNTQLNGNNKTLVEKLERDHEIKEAAIDDDDDHDDHGAFEVNTEDKEDSKDTSLNNTIDSVNDIVPKNEDTEEDMSQNYELNMVKQDTEGQGAKKEINNSDELNDPSYDIQFEKKEEKKVKFADELDNTDSIQGSEQPESRQPTPLPEIDAPEEVFEGPPQRVARNTIYLIDFDEDNKDLKLNETNIKTILFGPQSILPASRRFKDLKTILRIGQVENPYATVKEERNELFQPASDLTEENPIFEELKKLPRLGIKQAFVEEIEEDKKEETTAIVVKTEAPTGLYLPNGNKKHCLISGTEVKYFDPSNGIPYSSVETYRLLKSIEQGNVPWYSFGSDVNDTGATEFYLGSRDGSTTHAKGVPEGFDG